MENVEVTIEDVVKSVRGIYYISNNNYYFLYTEGNRDENGYIVLNVVKVLQEVVNTPTGQAPTGNLVGLTIAEDQEWKDVQKDISNIIDDKQNKKQEAVRYLDLNLLQKLIVKSTRIFRLKEERTHWMTKYYKEIKTENAELIIVRDPLQMKDILTSENKFKYIQQ